MSVKLTLEFATMAELTTAVARLQGAALETKDQPQPSKPAGKPAKGETAPPAPTPPSAGEPAAAAPAPSPATKERAYKDTKIAELINAAVDAGKGPDVKKVLIQLEAFDPADATKSKVKGPFIKPADFDKAEELLKALVSAKEDMS